MYYVSFFWPCLICKDIWNESMGSLTPFWKISPLKITFPASHLPLCLKGCRRRKHCSVILALDQQKIKIPIQIFSLPLKYSISRNTEGFWCFFFFHLFFVSSKCESDYTFVWKSETLFQLACFCLHATWRKQNLPRDQGQGSVTADILQWAETETLEDTGDTLHKTHHKYGRHPLTIKRWQQGFAYESKVVISKADMGIEIAGLWSRCYTYGYL